jgi:hypothetical protein
MVAMSVHADHHKDEDGGNYKIATASFNLRNLFIQSPIRVVLVALVS